MRSLFLVVSLLLFLRSRNRQRLRESSQSICYPSEKSLITCKSLLDCGVFLAWTFLFGSFLPVPAHKARKSGVRHHSLAILAPARTALFFSVNFYCKKQSRTPFGCFAGCHKNRAHHSSSRLLLCLLWPLVP